MNPILKDARQRKYAIAAFDVCNYEMIKCVVEAAEELRSPVILSALKVDIVGHDIEYFMALCENAAKWATVPVAIHLDHSTEQKEIERAILHGFSSVMYDGSSLPFDENAYNTAKAAEFAHKHGVSIEAELGHVTNAIAGDGESGAFEDGEVADWLTDPHEVETFVERTGVDALAVAVGTAHGVYRSAPKLDFERLEEINRISKVPLVLHGGSGTPDELIKKSIQLGVCKINIFSELLYAFNNTMKDTLNALDNLSSWPSVVYKEPKQAMTRVVKEKILLFGSDNKA
jgi:ketose-bisphosphate aldolase